jgi:hypothetical protein
MVKIKIALNSFAPKTAPEQQLGLCEHGIMDRQNAEFNTQSRGYFQKFR